MITPLPSGGRLAPICLVERDSQTCAAWVVRAGIWATMSRQAPLASSSSRHRCGTAPMEMANTTLSKSSPAFSVLRATGSQGVQ